MKNFLCFIFGHKWNRGALIAYRNPTRRVWFCEKCGHQVESENL